MSSRTLFTKITNGCVLAAGLVLAGCGAGELTPSFPNYALSLPAAEVRSAAAPVPDTDQPFTWDQFAVMLEGGSALRQYHAFDPLLQPIEIFVLPSTPVNVRVNGFDSASGLQSVAALAKTGGLTEPFQFQAEARNILTPAATFTYDIRKTGTRIRGTPLILKSPGDFIKPGQIVRYEWPSVTNERMAAYEAEFSGRTGVAKGISTTSIARPLAVKAQPFVLGHYLMTVTPRDVRGEPPRGSMSNGQVFRCVFGSDNLPPATDGFMADTFTPAVNQVVTLQPFAVDPETGQNVFSNSSYEFGDGTFATGIRGATTHAYAQPGIYRVRCTVADGQGLTATAEDSIVVGATNLPKLSFKFVKQIPPEEAGDGSNGLDSLTAAFKDPSGKKVGAGDRIVFTYNRNHFGRISASDHADDVDIILKPGGFQGSTRLAKAFSVTAGGSTVSIAMAQAQFDRTGDPRFGRCELTGIFRNQRIALAIIPADGSTPRVLSYTGNMQARVKGGQSSVFVYVPETSMNGTTTTLQPNPRLQDP